MLIYESQPNRVYPSMARAICLSHYNAYEFSSQYHFYDEKNWEKAYESTLSHQSNTLKSLPRTKSEKINKVFLSRQIHLDNIDAIFGLFRGEFLDGYKKSNDYAFSIIDSPLEQVSNLYSYLTFMIDKIKENQPGVQKLAQQNLLVAGKFDYFDKYNGLTIHFQRLFPTYEKYIDFIIEIKGDFKNFWIQDYGIKWCFSNHFLRCTYLSKHLDFVGIMSDEKLLKKSLKVIANDMNYKNIGLVGYKVPRYLIKNSYRRKDLTKIFQNEIDYFNEKLKILNGT